MLSPPARSTSAARLERRAPRAAIAAGLAYVPQERKSEGLLLAKSVGDNITYAILRQLRSFLGLLDPRYEGELVRGAIARAKIHTRRGGREPIANLSGGNQQKALLEKWLLTKPSILLLNDVTRGVDIGTKRLIYALIAEMPARALLSSGIPPMRASWSASSIASSSCSRVASTTS